MIMTQKTREAAGRSISDKTRMGGKYFKWLQKRPILYPSCEFVYDEVFIFDVKLKPRKSEQKFCINKST